MDTAYAPSDRRSWIFVGTLALVFHAYACSAGTRPVEEPQRAPAAALPRGVVLSVLENATTPLLSITVSLPRVGCLRDPIAAELAALGASAASNSADLPAGVLVDVEVAYSAVEVRIIGTTLVANDAFRVLSGLRRPIELGPETLARARDSAEQAYENPQRLAQHLALSIAHRGSPNLGPGLDDLADLQRCVRRAWLNEVYLAIVGDMPDTELRRHAEDALVRWYSSDVEQRAEGGSSGSPRSGAEGSKTSMFIVDDPDARRVTIAIAFPLLTRLSEDYANQQILNYVFGGAHSSRLTQLLREELGLVYLVRSRTVPGDDHDLSLVTTDAAVEQAMTAVGAVLSSCRDLRENPPSEADLVMARGAARFDYLLSMEPAALQGLAINDQNRWNLPRHDPFDAGLARSGALKHPRIHCEAASVVVVGPAASLEAAASSVEGIRHIKVGPPPRWSGTATTPR